MPLTPRLQRAACCRTKYAASSGEVVAPLAQRRHRQRDDVEAEVEILAERALAMACLEIAVGGGDHADVDLDAAPRADALDDLLLQHAQQLGLQRRRQLADLVEKDGAAVAPARAGRAAARWRR